jgi:hypothetical protein
MQQEVRNTNVFGIIKDMDKAILKASTHCLDALPWFCEKHVLDAIIAADEKKSQKGFELKTSLSSAKHVNILVSGWVVCVNAQSVLELNELEGILLEKLKSTPEGVPLAKYYEKEIQPYMMLMANVYRVAHNLDGVRASQVVEIFWGKLRSLLGPKKAPGAFVRVVDAGEKSSIENLERHLVDDYNRAVLVVSKGPESREYGHFLLECMTLLSHRAFLDVTKVIQRTRGLYSVKRLDLLEAKRVLRERVHERSARLRHHARQDVEQFFAAKGSVNKAFHYCGHNEHFLLSVLEDTGAVGCFDSFFFCQKTASRPTESDHLFGVTTKGEIFCGCEGLECRVPCRSIMCLCSENYNTNTKVFKGGGVLEAFRQGLVELSVRVMVNPRYIVSEADGIVCRQGCEIDSSVTPVPITEDASFEGFTRFIHNNAPHLVPRPLPETKNSVDCSNVHGFVMCSALDMGFDPVVPLKKSRSKVPASSSTTPTEPLLTSTPLLKTPTTSHHSSSPPFPVGPSLSTSSSFPSASGRVLVTSTGQSPAKKKVYSPGAAAASAQSPVTFMGSSVSSRTLFKSTEDSQALTFFLRTVDDANNSGGLALMGTSSLNTMSRSILEQVARSRLKNTSSEDKPQFTMQPGPSASKWVLKKHTAQPTESMVAAARNEKRHNIPLLLMRHALDDLSVEALRVAARQHLPARALGETTPKPTIISWFYQDVSPKEEDSSLPTHNISLLLTVDGIGDIQNTKALWRFARDSWGIILNYDESRDGVVKALREQHEKNKASKTE